MDSSQDDGSRSSVSADGPLARPLSRALVELLLDADGNEKGMVLLVNEAARFKAASSGETLDEITLETVREEILDEHVGPLERAGLVAYDGEEDRLSLADSERAVRARLDAASERDGRDSYK
ncbi:MAG: hypothetical protein ABEJ26_07115 [Halosimplex sp.]